MTPGRAEIESAAKAIWDTPLPPEAGPGMSRLECEEAATAALAAAEQVRARNFEEGAGSGNAPDRSGESGGALGAFSTSPDPPGENVTPSSEHSCHADCSCQTGGEPTPDFLGVRPALDDVMEAGRRVVDARTPTPSPDWVEAARAAFESAYNGMPSHAQALDRAIRAAIAAYRNEDESNGE